MYGSDPHHCQFGNAADTGWFTEDPFEITERFGGVWKTSDFHAGDVIIFTMRFAIHKITIAHKGSPPYGGVFCMTVALSDRYENHCDQVMPDKTCIYIYV